MSVDNNAVLYVNANDAGTASDWHQPAEIDVTTLLRDGPNVLAIAATNTTDKPNPAGLLGMLVVEFASGDPLKLAVDASWKVSQREVAGWTAAGFDDASWPAAQVVAPFGGGPWGRPTGRALTLSPVTADPFSGHAEIPSEVDLAKARVYLELEGLSPEEAARVTVNGQDAVGFIGRPLRLDVTRFLKPGANTIRIEPFAPKSARLAYYRQANDR